VEGTLVRRTGCFFVDLFVRASNKAAIKFYHRLGYRTYRRVLRYYGDDHEDALDLRKATIHDPTGESCIPLPRPVRPEEIKWD
jgi:N-terminal acetyltransferase B complex catalytic subunit